MCQHRQENKIQAPHRSVLTNNGVRAPAQDKKLEFYRSANVYLITCSKRPGYDLSNCAEAQA